MAELVSGRGCDACVACCVITTIDTPEIQKKSGRMCRHCDRGCTIYDTRPAVCREFYCAWRRVEFLPDAWRPDLSGIYCELEQIPAPHPFAGSIAVSLMLIGAAPQEILRREDFADFVAASLRAGRPLFLGVPGPVGHQGCKVLLNTRPMLAALTDRAAFQALLEEALAKARHHVFRPQPLVHGGHDVGGA